MELRKKIVELINKLVREEKNYLIYDAIVDELRAAGIFNYKWIDTNSIYYSSFPRNVTHCALAWVDGDELYLVHWLE